MTCTLWFGDNLEILRRYLKDETVDLIYLDPRLTPRRLEIGTFQYLLASGASVTWLYRTDKVRDASSARRMSGNHHELIHSGIVWPPLIYTTPHTILWCVMAIGSAIEWTEATWNPTTGCSKVSSGCANCYAETLAKRLHAMGMPKYDNGFTYTEHESAVDIPLTWKKPRRIFVNSMSDLFHEDATPEFIARCFDVMTKASWHTYQILTKRSHRMKDFSYMFERYFGAVIPNHIWMGTSVENADALYRLDDLPPS